LKTLKPLRLSFLHRTFEHKRRVLFVPSILVLFPFASPKSIGTEVELWKIVGSELGPSGVLDHCMWKPQGELLVSGACYPPGGKPAPWGHVRVSLGPIDKTLYVIGDRTWGMMGPSEPVPFSRMPIDYAHAFGGEKYPQNPVGKGLSPVKNEAGVTAHPLPNVEDPKQVVKGKGDRPTPASLGPWDITWPHHFAKMGTYDKKWREEQFPGLALDADLGVFNVAPPDQRLPGYFQGDEAFRVENMHPEKSVLESRLPGVIARCFLQFSPDRGDELVEVPMHLDTVHLFPHLERGLLIFRGLTEIKEPDAADIRNAMVALEDQGGELRPLSHYEAVLAQRLDRKKAHLYMLRDGDLLPESVTGAPKVRPASADALDDIVQQENLVRKNARRRAERELEKERARFIEAGVDPATIPEMSLPPEEEEPSLEELPAYVEKMEAEVEKHKTEAERMQIEQENRVRMLCEENGIDYDEIVAKNRKEQGGPPKFTAEGELSRLRDLHQLSLNAGVEVPGVKEQLADPGLEEKLRAAEDALHLAYYIGAHLQEPVAPLDAEANARARRELTQAYVKGERSARRDFCGVDLAGMDLAGVDLEGAYLEGANLAGCNLTGANLARAVLARANLKGAKLSLANLREANLGRAVLEETDLEGADLEGAILYEADCRNARLVSVRLNGAQLLEIRVEGADFSGAVGEKLIFLKTNLAGVRWSGARLHLANFIETDMTGADFERADLTSASFITVKADGARFDDATLENVRFVHGSTLEGASFKGVRMSGSNLRDAKLSRSDLSAANVSRSDLSGADLRAANLEGLIAVDARFVRTDLREARLISANLMLGVLHNARLASADFTGANLFAADLTRAVGDDATRFDGANLKRVVHQGAR
jgi:uncharacterized protein YjbI with pentapeptide repeats